MPHYLAPDRQLLQVALTNVHLFESQGATSQLLALVASVTGIPPETLRAAEHRVARTGSIAPLRELLANPAVPKVDGLRYELTLRQAHRGARTTPAQEVAQRLTIAMASGRGKVEVNLTVVLNRSRLAAALPVERQVARISVSYRADDGARLQAFRHQVTIAGDRRAQAA